MEPAIGPGQLLERKPTALSGGQRQRVAIGRALVRDVDVFLLEEPLSNLDAKLRAELRVELERLHRDISNTMIYVTHDQVETMTLADRIDIMKDGIIQQFATPDEIHDRPANTCIAGFIDAPPMNLMVGRLAEGRFDGPFSGDLSGCSCAAARAVGAVTLGLRPEYSRIGEGAAGADLTAEAMIDMVEPMGADAPMLARVGDQDIRIRTDGKARYLNGVHLTIATDLTDASVIDTASGQRL